MGLFGKKKEEKSCCCGDSCTPEKMAQAEAAKTALLRTWPKVWAVHPVRCGAHVCRGR